MPWYIGVAGCLGILTGNALGFGLVWVAFVIHDHRRNR